MNKWWLFVPAGAVLILVLQRRRGLSGEKGGSGGEDIEYEEIRLLTGLKSPDWFPMKGKEEDEEREPRLPASIVSKDIGSFHIELKKSKTGGCTVKLQENQPGWKRKTIGSWNGEPAICEAKFKKVADVVRTIRFKRKTGKNE